MDIFSILLSQESSVEEGNKAVTKLIEEYDFPFDEETLYNDFKLFFFNPEILAYKKDCIDLFNTLLKDNKYCLIAILKCFERSPNSARCLYNVLLNFYDKNSKTCPYPIMILYNDVPASITWGNWCPGSSNCIICWAQQFYPFDVENIPMRDDYKQMIQMYRNGRNTKPAKIASK